MYKTQDKPANATGCAEVLRLGLRNGDKMADDLDYVPLPDSVKDLVRKQWADRSRTPSGKPVAFK
jgi:phosphate transport system substrate-binding protein